MILLILQQEELKQLSNWIAALSIKDIDQKTLLKTKAVFLDNLGAIIAGNFATEVDELERKLFNEAQPMLATIFKKGFPKSQLTQSMLINGIAGCWEELDEGYRLATCHAGMYTLPGLLAYSEYKNKTVYELFLALIVGYEVATRIASSYQFKLGTIHPHGIYPVICTAVSIAKLQEFTPEQIYQTINLSLALTFASPFNQATEGALSRNLWTGLGAVNGFTIVQAVESGFTSIDSVLTDVFENIYKAERVQPVNINLGNTYFAINDGYHKKYACCQYGHSSLEAMQILRDRNMNKEIETIIANVHEKGLLLQNKEPGTSLAAKFSLEHILATTWHGYNGEPEAFTKKAIQKENIQKLRRKISLKQITEVKGDFRSAKIQTVFKDGTMDEAFVEIASGDPLKPLSIQELKDKFMYLTNGIIKHPSELFDYIYNLDRDISFKLFLRKMAN